jgi:hypothetical protein
MLPNRLPGPFEITAVLSLCFTGGCSSEPGNSGTSSTSVDGGSVEPGAGGNSSQASETGGQTGLGFGDCSEPCESPKRCSLASHTCLAPGACVADGDCPTGQTCNTTSMACEIGGECGGVAFQIEGVPPNVLILLDRSGSMNGDADGDTRWNVAKDAIDKVTTTLGDKIRFGLATYSSCLPGGCSAGSIVTPIAEGSSAEIRAFLASTVDERSSDGQGLTSDGKLKYLCDSGKSETSTGKSLSALVGEPSLLDAFRSNAVILLTDGKENDDCRGDCDGPCGAKRLLTQSPPVKTYVIGLGVNADAVDAIAEAGGTSRSIPTTNLAELSNAFDQIAVSVASCDYVLTSAPPNAEDLFVFFNDDPAQVPRNDVDGWSYAPSDRAFKFHGTACEQVKSGAAKNIDIVYGCPRPIIK